MIINMIRLINAALRRLPMVLEPLLTDSLYLKMAFYPRLGYRLNLQQPRTFNEKIQWLKLNDIHPEYTKMVDKIEAKEYVCKVMGG